MAKRPSRAWIDTWALFGVDVRDRLAVSAPELWPDDKESSDYIYGWYIFVCNAYGETFRFSLPVHDKHKAGYEDAEAYYDLPF